jgi:hypothetical protein
MWGKKVNLGSYYHRHKMKGNMDSGLLGDRPRNGRKTMADGFN